MIYVPAGLIPRARQWISIVERLDKSIGMDTCAYIKLAWYVSRAAPIFLLVIKWRVGRRLLGAPRINLMSRKEATVIIKNKKKRERKNRQKAMSPVAGKWVTRGGGVEFNPIIPPVFGWSFFPLRGSSSRINCAISLSPFFSYLLFLSRCKRALR